MIRGIEGDSRISSVLGLKVRPSDANGLAPQRSAEHRRDFARHSAFAVFIDCKYCFDDAHRGFVVLRGFDQRAGVFRKARPTKAWPGMKKFRADAVVESNAAGDLLHIGADLFG